MKKNTPKYGSWFVTLPIGGGVLLFIYFAFLPTSHEIQALRSELEEERNIIVAAEALRGVIGEMEDKVAEGHEYLAQWDAKTPDDAQRAKFYGEIHRQIKESGARTTRFDPIEQTPYASFSAHRLAVGSAGNFGQLMQVLASLEQLPFALWIDELHFDVSPETGSTIGCEATLVVFADLSGNSD